MLILVLGGNVVISFENDYLEGAHEKVLKRLVDTNLVQASGYGFDQFTAQAIEKIKDTIDCPNATIRFLVGGTQTNQVVINSMLESYEGVISAHYTLNQNWKSYAKYVSNISFHYLWMVHD